MYLCSNSSHHASRRTANQGGTFAFYIPMRYSKQPLDFADILKLLKSHGLIIQNESKAIECLKVISYFRLDNYFHPMESDKALHTFKSNSYFENAVDLYTFDSKLRSLIFSAIQSIEIALRSKMIHHFSLSYGAFWFTDDTLFKSRDIFDNCLKQISKNFHAREKISLSSIRTNIQILMFLLFGKHLKSPRLEHYPNCSVTSLTTRKRRKLHMSSTFLSILCLKVG